MPLSEWSPLLTLAGTVVIALFSAGGVVAWRRLSHDRKVGIAQQEVVEDDAEAARWKSLIEMQTRSLLEPALQRISNLEQSVERLEAELAATRRKYWMAISYIRTLLTWIDRHLNLVEDLEVTAIPNPQAELVEDI